MDHLAKTQYHAEVAKQYFIVPVAFLVLVVWSGASGAELRGKVVDEKSGKPLPARIYIRDASGGWHFTREGSGIRYEKRNWLNQASVEMHTTVPEQGFIADLPPGRYTMIAERGKEYFPVERQIDIASDAVEWRAEMKRWIDMAERGWYSGETHLHRSVMELRNVVLAEDLNVAFPLSYWVTKAFVAPGAGDRSDKDEVPERLVEVDGTHVIWPRNTEYEIFTVGEKQHTLGAIFVLGHRSIPTEGVPPWGGVATKASADGAMLDMDKLDWPFAMTLPPTTGAGLYELANNHVWRTEFAFRQWNAPAAPYLQPPAGGTSGSEREWVHYTLGMYYTLLNCGFRIQPTAGTANGVHPVPAGFSRVYVNVPDGFTYEKWVAGLRAGRSFVTTGPMLFAKVNEQLAGEVFRSDSGPVRLTVSGTVRSEQRLAFAEVIRDGVPALTFMPQNRPTAEGAYESDFTGELLCEKSGWVAVRCWEDRPGGRFRFAHTAPWHVQIAGKPPRPRAEEKTYLIRRMKDEMARSKGIVPAEAMAEYERALDAYENLDTFDEPAKETRTPREEELRDWLENMVWHHRFTADEMRAATGMSRTDLAAAMERLKISDANRPKHAPGVVRVLPYPGGRHPRSGFFEGAIDPQRDTKFSIFTPWDEASYVVVDLPEAVFSDLGLLYLAHTHVPMIWSARGDVLPKLEWNRRKDGSLENERRLPNGIRFGARVVPDDRIVAMELWLHNGTDRMLRGLRVQNCMMLKAAMGFSAQTSQNKLLRQPYAAVKSEDGHRWIITAWSPAERMWANPPVPCMHSEPHFPDIQPGETRRVRGQVWFYEGDDIDGELKRIESTGWAKQKMD